MYGRHGPRHEGRLYKSGGRFRGGSRTGRGGRGARAQQQTALAQQAALRAAREQARVLQGLLDASKETLQELSEKHSAASKASNSSRTARSRQVGDSPSRHDNKVAKLHAAPALKAAAHTPTVLASAPIGSLSAVWGGPGPNRSGSHDRARAPVSPSETAVAASAAPQQDAEQRSDGLRVTMTPTMAGVRGGGEVERGHESPGSDGAACGAVDTDSVLQEVLAWAETYQRQVAEGSADILAGLLGEPAAADHHRGFPGVSLEPWLRKGGHAVDNEGEEPDGARSSKRQKVDEVREAEQSSPRMPYDPSHGPLKYLDSSSSRQLWPDTDPVVCPYDLHGTCNDEECAFLHLSRLSLKGARDQEIAKGAATTPLAQRRGRNPRPYPWQWKPSVTLPAFRSLLLTGRGGVNHAMVVTMEPGETGGERREQEAGMEDVLLGESDEEGRGLGERVDVLNQERDAEGSDEEMSYLPLPQTDEDEHVSSGMEVLIPHTEQETQLAPTTSTANGPGAQHVKPEPQAVRYFSSLSPAPLSIPLPTLSDLEHRVSTHPHDVKAWLSLALATLATSPPTTDTSLTPPPSPSNRRSSSRAALHMLSSPEHVSVWLSAWLDNGPPDPTAVRPAIRLLARALDALAGGGGGRSEKGGGGRGADQHVGERTAKSGQGVGHVHMGGATNGVKDADSVKGDAAQGLSVLWLLYLRLYTSLPLPPPHIRSTTAHEAVCTQQPGSLPLWLLSESMTRALAADLPSLLTYYQSSITHLCSLPPDPVSYGPPLAFLTVRYAATLLHSGHGRLASRAMACVLGVTGDFSTAIEIHTPLPELSCEPLLPYMSVSSASLLCASYLYLLATGATSSTLLSLASCPPPSSSDHAIAHTTSPLSVAWGWRTRLRLAGDRALLDSLREAFTSLFTWLDSDDTSFTDVIDGGSDGVQADDAEDLWIAVLEWNHDLLCDLWGGQRRGGPLWWRWGLGSMYTWTTAVRLARESWQVTWVDDLASWALSAAALPWRDGAALACTCEWLCDGADNPSTLAKTRGLLVALNGRAVGRDGYGAGSLQEGVAVEAHRLVRDADTGDQDQRLFRMMIEVQVTRVLQGTAAAGRLLREAIAASCVKAHAPLEPMHRAQLWLELLALSPTAETADAALCDVSSIVDTCGGKAGMGLEEAVEWSLSTRVLAQEHAHHACAALMSAVMSLHTPSRIHLCHTTLNHPTGPVPPSLLPLLARALVLQAVNRPSLTPVLLRLRISLRGTLIATITAWSRRDRCPSLSPHGPRSSLKSTCGMLAQAVALIELALGEPGRAQKALESALALEPWHVGLWEFLLRLQAAFSTPQRVEQVTRAMLEQAVSSVNLRDTRTWS